MVIISIVSSFIVADSLHSQVTFSFDIKGVIFMVLIALIIAFISSFVFKISPVYIVIFGIIYGITVQKMRGEK